MPGHDRRRDDSSRPHHRVDAIDDVYTAVSGETLSTVPVLSHNRRIGHPLRRVLIVGVLVARTVPAQAQYTDELVLWDGNTIWGEVKGLRQGRLEFKIDKAGTVYAEWDRVFALRSNKFFEVENQEGEFFYGILGASSQERELVVIEPQGTIDVLAMDEVVRIMRIEHRFIERIDGFLTIGASFTSAQSILQYNFDGEGTYRRKTFSSSVRLGSSQTRQEDRDDVFRSYLDIDYTRYRRDRYFGTGTLSFFRSSELGVSLRTQLSGAYGRTFVQSNRTQLSAQGGLAVSNERPFGDEPADNSLWADISGEYRFFVYSFPKTDITVNLALLPGITQWPRWRADLYAAAKREIFKDFTVNVSIYDHYDSDPPPEAESTHDFGLVLGVGWTF